MKCSNCGIRIKKKFNLCPNCGEEIIIEQKSKNTINKGSIIVMFTIIVLIILILIVTKNNKVGIEDLKDSVVQVYVYDEENEVIATGSGVVAFENDIVLTNAHVIEDNYKLEIISENNTKYKVKGIIGYNRKKDIAILKLSNNKELKALKIKQKISVGDEVTAIGSPLGLKNTVSDGILSGYFQDNIEVYQHTAPISSGSSGGALFDNKGNLVGITYASINGGQNLNLAIPIAEFEKEYKIVKDNKNISARYYSFLNNSIYKTKNGSAVLEYVLNDEYGNERFESGTMDESKVKEGNLEKCNSLDNCSFVSEKKYKKISNYISSSIYISSGIPNNTILNEDGSAELREGEGYSVVLIKLNNSSVNVISQLKEFVKTEFEFDEWEFNNNSKYLYGLSCKNYNRCNNIKKILYDFVK